uniref:Peptidase A2 domain-containing protein n=1 Tax=Cacopsylla melanoneura TaxID=428564 RepID=A0A8D8REB8_9HEMI
MHADYSSDSNCSSDSNFEGNMFHLQINSVKNNSPEWYQVFTFKNTSLNLKLDTGADISVINLSNLNKISTKLRNRLSPSNLIVRAFGGQQIKILGSVKISLKNKQNSEIVKFYVTPDSEHVVPILGAKECEKLGLIKRIHSVDRIPSESEIVKKNKDLFQGIGKIKNVQYEIKRSCCQTV